MINAKKATGIVLAAIVVWLSLPSAAVGLFSLLPRQVIEFLQPWMNQTRFSVWLGLAYYFVAFVGVPVGTLTLVLNIPVLAIRDVPRWLKVISSCFLALGIVGVVFMRLLPRH